jgi:hypothetical protein
VVLDPGAAYPADRAVDDHRLAMVDVPELCAVPSHRSGLAQRSVPATQLRRTDDEHVDAAGDETIVELAAGALRI